MGAYNFKCCKLFCFSGWKFKEVTLRKYGGLLQRNYHGSGHWEFEMLWSVEPLGNCCLRAQTFLQSCHMETWEEVKPHLQQPRDLKQRSKHPKETLKPGVHCTILIKVIIWLLKAYSASINIRITFFLPIPALATLALTCADVQNELFLWLPL